MAAPGTHRDPEAFAFLCREYRGTVYGCLPARTRDRHQAEDLTQEVFARALRNISGFAWRGTDPAAWLTTIARNIHLDELGRSRHRREMPVAECGDPGQPGPEPETLVLRDLDAVDARETVHRALSALARPNGPAWNCGSSAGCRSSRPRTPWAAPSARSRR